MDARIEDLSVLEVGAGSTLAAQTLISSHDEDPDNWRFVQTRIGQGVFVGMYSQLRVGTHAEDGVWIGMRNRLKGTHLPAGTRIPDFGVSP